MTDRANTLGVVHSGYGGPLRIGLLGASRVATFVIIDPASQHPDVEVRAVAARDPARARRYANRHGIAKVEATYGDLIRRDDLDLVYVGLPHALHAEWSIRALDAGHAVLCEKPFALNAADAHHMVSAAERAGRPLMEAFHYRHHALMRRLLMLVDRGAIGALTRLSGHFDAGQATDDAVRWSEALGGGALYDLGCYVVHAFRTIMRQEPIITASRAEFREGVDAALEMDMVFGQVRARASCSMIAPRREANLRLEGTGGFIEVENFVAPQLGHRLRVTTASHAQEIVVAGPTTFEAQLKYIVAVLQGEEEPITGGRDAVANTVAIEAALALAGRSGLVE